MVVNIEIEDVIWVLSPQLSLVVALIVFRAIEVDVMEVRKVISHQIVQNDAGKIQPLGFVGKEFNTFLENSQSLCQKAKCIFNDL